MLEVKADLGLSPNLRFLSVWVKSIVLPRSFLSLVFSWFNSVLLIVGSFSLANMSEVSVLWACFVM